MEACKSSMTTRFLEGLAGPLFGRAAMEVAVLNPAAEKQDRAGVGEVAMHAVEFEVLERGGHFDLVFYLFVGLAFDQRVAAEFAGEDDQGAVQQSARLEVENQLRDRGIDCFFMAAARGLPVLMGVPVEERNILGGDLDIPGSDLGQAAGKEAAQAETSDLLLVPGAEAVLGGVEAEARLIVRSVSTDIRERFEREVEGFRGRRTQ